LENRLLLEEEEVVASSNRKRINALEKKMTKLHEILISTGAKLEVMKLEVDWRMK